MSVLAAAGFYWSRAGVPAARFQSLALLPLEGDAGPGLEVFEGLVDAVTADLSRDPTLHVATLASTAAYKDTTKSPQAIGHEQGLTGS